MRDGAGLLAAQLMPNSPKRNFAQRGVLETSPSRAQKRDDLAAEGTDEKSPSTLSKKMKKKLQKEEAKLSMLEK